MITTAQFEKTNATVKKIVGWAISRLAPEKSGEGSTTNIKAYRMVPKPAMTRARGCLTTMFEQNRLATNQGNMVVLHKI